MLVAPILFICIFVLGLYQLSASIDGTLFFLGLKNSNFLIRFLIGGLIFVLYGPLFFIFIPLSFYGCLEVWNWNWYQAIFLHFAIPLMAIILIIIDWAMIKIEEKIRPILYIGGISFSICLIYFYVSLLDSSFTAKRRFSSINYCEMSGSQIKNILNREISNKEFQCILALRKNPTVSKENAQKHLDCLDIIENDLLGLQTVRTIACTPKGDGNIKLINKAEEYLKFSEKNKFVKIGEKTKLKLKRELKTLLKKFN